MIFLQTGHCLRIIIFLRCLNNDPSTSRRPWIRGTENVPAIVRLGVVPPLWTGRDSFTGSPRGLPRSALQHRCRKKQVRERMGSNGVADSSPLPVSERINDTGQSAGKPAVPMHESEGDRRGNPATSGKRRRLRAVQPIQFASPGLDTFAGSRKEFRRPPLSAKDTANQILPTLRSTPCRQPGSMLMEPDTIRLDLRQNAGVSLM